MFTVKNECVKVFDLKDIVNIYGMLVELPEWLAKDEQDYESGQLVKFRYVKNGKNGYWVNPKNLIRSETFKGVLKFEPAKKSIFGNTPER